MQEETHQKDFFHAPEGLRQLLRSWVISQHGPKHQGTKLGTQADGFEAEATHDECQQQAKQDQQLIMAAGIQKAVKQWPE